MWFNVYKRCRDFDRILNIIYKSKSKRANPIHPTAIEHSASPEKFISKSDTVPRYLVQLGLIKVEVGGYVLTEEGINKVVAGGFTWQYWQSFAKTGFQVIASVALLYVSVAGFYNDVKKNDKPSWQLQAELNKLRQAEKVVLYKDSTYTEYLLYHLPK